MISIHDIDAAPGFDHPLEMLLACHGKILRQCDTLQKLAVHLSIKGCDEQAQQAAKGILRYFDTAAQFHHQDEEQNLFPALCAIAELPLLDRLLGEHIEMQSAWRALRPMLVLIASGQQQLLAPELTEKFIHSHREHIAIENAELLPLAASLLDDQQLALIGKCMAERRGAARHFG